MAKTPVTSSQNKADAISANGSVKSQLIATRNLFLDPLNPRLTGERYSIGDQEKILKRLWDEFNLREITDSIVARGEFWRHEPLIAAREGNKLVVIKGNRRLGAVPWLWSANVQTRIG